MAFNPFKTLGNSFVAVFSGKATSRQYINVFIFLFVITTAAYLYIFIFRHGQAWGDLINGKK
jgi:hypothetical protein